MSTPPYDHKESEALALAIMAALGITRPVCALTLHWRAGEMATVTVEEYMPPTVGGGADVIGKLSHYMLTPTTQEPNHAG